MLSATKQKIVQFLQQNPDSSTKQIIDYLGITKQAVARHLVELIQLGLIDKKGRPPRVFYFYTNNTQIPVKTIDLNYEISDKIEHNFILLTSDGQLQLGLKSFQSWCTIRQFDIDQYAQKYSQILDKYNSYKNRYGLIDATHKLLQSYKNQSFLNALYYSEFSAYEIFGRTKLYSYLLYGKQTENRNLIRETISTIKEDVLNLIIKEKIDAVGFIPPTVPRSVQFQKEFEKYLNLPLPVIKIEKVRNYILVPQKTLKTPFERIENSIKTIVVSETRNFENILLIDDFVGSGATLNFTAQKIKNKFKSVNKVIGYAICGTPNGVIDSSQKFEVVNEV